MITQKKKMGLTLQDTLCSWFMRFRSTRMSIYALFGDGPKGNGINCLASRPLIKKLLLQDISHFIQWSQNCFENKK